MTITIKLWPEAAAPKGILREAAGSGLALNPLLGETNPPPAEKVAVQEGVLKDLDENGLDLA